MFLPQRDSTMVFFHFFSKLAEEIKREGSFPYDFPILFASSRSEPVSCTRSTRKTGNFMEWRWFPSLQIFVPSSLSSSFLDFLAQFLFSCLPPIRSTPERSSFRYPRGPLLVFLRIIYFPSELFPVRIIVCPSKIES